MEDLSLSDLHNPRKIIGIGLKSGDYVEAAEDQGFQEYPGSWELWQMMDGKLFRVRRWLKKSVFYVMEEKEKISSGRPKDCNVCPFWKGRMNKAKGVKIPGGFGKCIHPDGHCSPDKVRR